MSSGGGLHSLATIIKRLEAATSRLEDLAIAGAGGQTTGPATSALSSGTPAPPPPPPPPPHIEEETPRSVQAFDETVKAKLESFVQLTKSLAPPVVVDQIAHVEAAFAGLRDVLNTAAKCTKPDGDAFTTLQQPVAKEVHEVVAFPDKNAKERDWRNHLMAISEGIPSIGWIGITPKPGPYVSQMKESAEFYTNRLIKEFREKDAKQVEWARAWIQLIEEQRKYVMEFHTTGLAWNPKGIPLSQLVNMAATAGGPPPPPPPPPIESNAPAATATPTAGIGAVFAELNKGSEITKGLRKVDKSEMTHKNPELRASSAVPASPPSKKPVRPSKPAALAGKKPSKMALEGTKWVVEYFENEPSLVVDNVEINQTVNLFGCKNTTIQVKGKCNAVTLVNCAKTAVLVDSVVSSVSVTNSPSFTIQVTGTAPTIQLDSTDSGQIYLSRTCLDAEITTAKCSAINISLPVEGEEDGVFVERAVPEMMRTVVQDGKLITNIVEHSG